MYIIYQYIAIHDGYSQQVNFFIGAYYDGLIHYGRTIKRCIDQGLNYTNGRLITRMMWNQTFAG